MLKCIIKCNDLFSITDIAGSDSTTRINVSILPQVSSLFILPKCLDCFLFQERNITLKGQTLALLCVLKAYGSVKSYHMKQSFF